VALVVLAGLAAYPVAAGNREVLVVLALGAAACALAAVGLAFRWWLVVAWGLALFGAEYAVFLRLRPDAVDAGAPLVAAALLVAAELAFGAVAAEGGRYERSLVAAEGLALAGAAFATVLAGGFLLVVAGTANAGVALEAVGAFAAVCAVGVVARIARGRAR
jgi:hypothetical protein